MKVVISIRVEGTVDVLNIDHETSTQAVSLLRGALGDNLRMILGQLVVEFVNNNAPMIIEFVQQESQLEELGRKRDELQNEIVRKQTALKQAKR